jgi:hypothetical protein
MRERQIETGTDKESRQLVNETERNERKGETET